MRAQRKNLLPRDLIDKSVAFFSKVFDWTVRSRGDGARVFDDTTGAVSGTWVLGRPASREAGVLTYVMVDSIDATLKKVTAAGGEVATPAKRIGGGSDAFAMFRDPAGNLFGLYQETQR